MSGLVDNTKAGQYAAYVLAPQINTDMWFQSYTSSPTEAMTLTMQALQQVINTENIDTSRIYVTGVSMPASTTSRTSSHRSSVSTGRR